MNDKIRKFSMSAMRKQYTNRTCTSRVAKQTLVTCGVFKSHITKGRGVYCLKFSLHPRMVDTLGWSKGDNIDMDVDLPNAMVAKVEPGVGVLLTQSSKGCPDVQRSAFRFTLFPEMGWPTTPVLGAACTEIECEAGLLAFRFPESVLTAIEEAQAPKTALTATEAAGISEPALTATEAAEIFE